MNSSKRFHRSAGQFFPEFPTLVVTSETTPRFEARARSSAWQGRPENRGKRKDWCPEVGRGPYRAGRVSSSRALGWMEKIQASGRSQLALIAIFIAGLPFDELDDKVGMTFVRRAAIEQAGNIFMLKASQNLALCRFQLFSGSRSWRRE